MATKESVLLRIKAWKPGCWMSLTDSKRHTLLTPTLTALKLAIPGRWGEAPPLLWVGVGNGREWETLQTANLGRAGSQSSGCSVRVAGSILGPHCRRWSESGPADGVSWDVAPPRPPVTRGSG